jgi:hypothetical protein
VISRLFEQSPITIEYRGGRAQVLHRQPGRVLRRSHRIVRAEAAEPEEAAGESIALRQVPVANVCAGIAQDADILEERGHQVDPTLLPMHAFRDVMAAVGEHPVLPPGQKLAG